MIRATLLLSASLVAATSLASLSAAQDVIESEQERFQIETVAEGFAFPWGLAFIGDDTYIVTERDGPIRLVLDGEIQPPLGGVPEAYVNHQGGMLDIALHPEFETNALVYFSFAEGDEAANHTALARGRLNIEDNRLEDTEVIFRAAPDKERGIHYGGRIAFHTDGTVLLSIGDGYIHMDDSQSPESHFGTLVRLNDDGSIPSDNPFVEAEGSAPSVYSYGHRNPQGLAIHPETGVIWMHEHGPRGGDEINLITPGTNYGWPAISYGIDYSGEIITEDREREGMAQPIWYWNPSIAPSGMTFYQGEAFPNWQGDLFVGALAGSKIERLELHGDRIISTEELLYEDLGERIRDVRTGPDGLIYFLVDSPEGALMRLVPAE